MLSFHFVEDRKFSEFSNHLQKKVRCEVELCEKKVRSEIENVPEIPFQDFYFLKDQI